MYRELHGAGKPESSLAAFGVAVRRGYAIELDVHLLSDGSVVVFYDDNYVGLSGWYFRGIRYFSKDKAIEAAKAWLMECEGGNES